MKKIWMLVVLFALLAVSVMAISYYANVNFKANMLYNISSINMSTGVLSGNITNVNCILYSSGGMTCAG